MSEAWGGGHASKKRIERQTLSVKPSYGHTLPHASKKRIERGRF